MSSKAKIYLYKEGNECNTITGGWGAWNTAGGNLGTFSKQSNCLSCINLTPSNQIYLSFDSKFNLREYSNIKTNLKCTNLRNSSANYYFPILSLRDSLTSGNSFRYSSGTLDINSAQIITLDVSDLTENKYIVVQTQANDFEIYSVFLETNDNLISIKSKDVSSVNFSCNTYDNLISITKAEVYINGVLSKTYTSNFSNITYNIDNTLCTKGNNQIKIKVTYTQGDGIYETVEEVLTHTSTEKGGLPTASSLKELIDRQELLTNSIEGQKNTLKSILESKNVEVLDSENKLSILIQKVNELAENPIRYLYKEGNECESLTGGWVAGANRYGASFTKNQTDILINVPYNSLTAYQGIVTSNKINISNYKKIVVEFNCTANLAAYYLGVINDKNDVAYITSISKITGKPVIGLNKIELDISSLTGDNYITVAGSSSDIHGGGAVKFNIHKIWLEK